MTSADLGRATQARFILDASRAGLLVSTPFDTAPGYDAIVDNGHRLFRVQVKGARPSTSRSSAGSTTYCINVNRHGRRMRYDLAAVWLEADAKWIFLPGNSRRKRQVILTPNGRHARRGWDVFRRR